MGSSHVRNPPPPQPAPKVQDKAVQEAEAEAIRRKSRSRGYQATILKDRMMTPEVQETLGS